MSPDIWATIIPGIRLVTFLTLVCRVRERSILLAIWFWCLFWFLSSDFAVAGSDASLVVTFLEEKPDTSMLYADIFWIEVVSVWKSLLLCLAWYSVGRKSLPASMGMKQCIWMSFSWIAGIYFQAFFLFRASVKVGMMENQDTPSSCFSCPLTLQASAAGITPVCLFCETGLWRVCIDLVCLHLAG